jgi:hypothetical protein
MKIYYNNPLLAPLIGLSLLVAVLLFPKMIFREHPVIKEMNVVVLPDMGKEHDYRFDYVAFDDSDEHGIVNIEDCSMTRYSDKGNPYSIFRAHAVGHIKKGDHVRLGAIVRVKNIPGDADPQLWAKADPAEVLRYLAQAEPPVN